MNKEEHCVGTLLKNRFMKPVEISERDLAKAIQIPESNIQEIVSGKKAISIDTDLRLCTLFSLEEGFFLKHQLAIEIKKSKKNIEEELKKIEPIHFLKKGMKRLVKNIRVALICGGPSQERGISLNSARSCLDHLSRQEIEVIPIYVDVYKNFYKISPAQLYSNTPSDFDFKLQTTAQKLNVQEFIQTLKEVDIVFPVIHGSFGEDGKLQELLEKEEIPFIGSESKTCEKMFDKHNAFSLLKRHGFPTIPAEVLRKNDINLEKTIASFFKTHSLHRVVVKPIAGGSSIGVFSADSPKDALEKTNKLFEMGFSDEVLIEPFCKGREFTIIILQNPDGSPVALIPTEIEVSYDNGGLFDYRRKYLPTTNTHWYCPPRFSDEVIDAIRKQGEELFTIFHMRDFARIDGWVLDDGRIIFTDFNPISGMEQNSFIFQQTSRIGMTHKDLLWNILKNGLMRKGLHIQEEHQEEKEDKKTVHVLFGGKTAERQVSLMSGTNVWLKLLKSKKYKPEPFLLDMNNTVWHLPYTYALNHTVEEIHENCMSSESCKTKMERYIKDIKERLSFMKKDYEMSFPRKLSFEKFLEISKETQAFIFLGLHGGEGEDGTFQDILEKHSLLYNGSGSQASKLCMDKYQTGKAISSMEDSNIQTVPKEPISIAALSHYTSFDFETLWKELEEKFQTKTFIIKPQNDGCSAGIVRLFSPKDLEKYLFLIQEKASFIPPNTFTNQPTPIEMPFAYEDEYLIESFIETDYIRIIKNDLVYKPKTGWIELTVGVLEQKGVFHALNPSITIAEGEVLSVEEKFQGGTGVNITPPSEEIISKEKLSIIKKAIEKIAKALNIQNYARLDIFFNVYSSKLFLIEANSLPGLTPATVLYHQALQENPSMNPREFLEHIIDLKRNQV